MTTVQIVGVAVAAAIVLLLVLALLVTRRRGEHEEVDAAPPAETAGSFLDAPLTDTLGKLGKAEHVPEEAEDSPGLEPSPFEASLPPGTTGQGLGLDWGPGGEADEAAAAGELAAAPADDTETTGDLNLPAGADEAGVPAPAAPAEGDAPASAPGARAVPLSDIIVTTSDKLVDLGDPEVRRMLADLVTFEIDQATQYRQQGQTVDAVLQLTEAEKICKALGMHETAQRIGRMMDDLKA